MTMTLDPNTVAAILAMAVACTFNRVAGFLLMRLVPLTPRVRRVLDALPGAVLISIVAPTAAHGDLAMAAGLLAALAVTLRWRNDFLAVLAAMLVGASLRAFGL